MSRSVRVKPSTVSFSERLASSPVLPAFFAMDMALVEETASYLDGHGRSESKKLERSAALVYATESMRLTTRLMQLASWLFTAPCGQGRRNDACPGARGKSKVRLASCEPGDAQVDCAFATQASRIDRALDQAAKVKCGGWMRTMHAPAPIKAVAGNPVETAARIAARRF